MVAVGSQFAFGVEIECLTAVPDNPRATESAIYRFLEILSQVAPTMPSSVGFFSPYAKFYCDMGHIEIAVIECCSPYLLASVVERSQALIGRALKRLAAEGIQLVLANNNHSGLLQEECPVWGDHENYLVERHPSTFTEEILPFLVTRIYAGSGGIHYPSGQFLAAVRPICMTSATGGGTTEMRAIHSTAREEHHIGPGSGFFRYHLILGDGHRSHFNLALQFGATALAVKAVLYDAQVRADLARLRREFSGEWVRDLRRLNVLANGGHTLRIDPLIVRTQRIYLDGARRYAGALADPPPWILRLLDDWEQTLTALERLDREWLAARLDAFTKYEFYSAVLADAGSSWSRLPSQPHLFHELALLDQSYHEFCNPESVFTRLEQTGALRHRVAAPVEPGAEPEPYIPETTTRARARARFIRDHCAQRNLAVEWAAAYDTADHRSRHLTDMFAADFSDWQAAPPPAHGSLPGEQTHLGTILAMYDRGEFEEAHHLLRRIERQYQIIGFALPQRASQYRAWLQARRGYTDAGALLDRFYRGQSPTWMMIADYCHVLRFQGLQPNLARMERWIQAGRQLLAGVPVHEGEPAVVSVFREHAAVALLRNGRVDEAQTLLDGLWATGHIESCDAQVKSRLLAVRGEIHRVRGERRYARRLLRQALHVESSLGLHGQMSSFTLPCLAKYESNRQHALERLEQAKQLQLRNHDRIGYVVSLLLEARLSGDAARAEEHRQHLAACRPQIPALAECPLLANILDNWPAWIGGGKLNGHSDEFWGL